VADIVLYAHRGSNPYPDHSLDAYVWAVNWGADVIEPDLYLTKDGVLVDSHDNHNYSNLTYAEAKALEPGLLTFGEVIELAKAKSIETGREIGIVPETKSTDYATSEAVIKELIAHGFTDPDRVVIQSFSSGNLQQLHNTIMPQYGVDIPLAFLGSGISNPASIATFADIVAPSFGSFSAADVAAAHAAGLKVVAWTILGSQADIQSLINMGVDAVFVDDMHLARPAVELIDGVTVVYGTPQWDVLNGTTGADKIYAMQGDDIVRAGDGDDVLYGDGGNDLLFGGAGNDHLVGGAGTDYLAGGAGSDVLDGGAGNDVIVATGDQVVFRAGNGIDLVSLDSTSTIVFEGVTPASVSVIRDGNNLIVRSGSDVLVLLNGVDPAHQPASITTADGFTLTGAELAALAVDGTDAEVAALLPGLETVLANAPTFAAPSTVAIGTDLVSEGDFGNGTLAQHIDNAETGAVYRLSFSLADLPTGDDGVRVLWNGQVIYEGTPDAAGSDLHFLVTGGSGNGANELVFESTGGSFGATLDDVHLVKITDPALPAPGNVAPEAGEANVLVSKDIPFNGKVVATDANNDVLSYSLGEGPAHGTLVFNASGSYRYTPAAGFTGTDGFTVLVSDGHGGLIETAVNLTVVPGIAVGTDLVVNGSFEDISISTGNNGAGDWGYRNAEGVIAGWTEVNHVRIEQHWDAPNGVVAKDGQMWIDMDGYNTNTHLVQQLAHVETGATYELSFSLGDADAAASDDGIRVMFGGRVVYEGIPTNPWQTFTFRVTGGAGDGSNKLEFIATGTNLNTYGAALDDVRFVKVGEPGETPDNVAPDAADGTASGLKGTVITGQLVATDANHDALLSFALGQGPAHGTVVIDQNGGYSYTPATGYTGTDAFTYTVSDGHGGVDTATVSLTVTAPLQVAIGTDLIVNGSFEDLTGLPTGIRDWGTFSETGIIPGWRDENGKRVEIHKDTQNGVSAKDGTYYFDLDGAGANASLVQTIASVETGATYRLTFSIADADGATADDGVRVLWGGQIIYEGTPDSNWNTLTFDLVGGAGDGSNKLVFQGTETNLNWYGAALDDVHFVKIANAPSTAVNLIVNGGFEDLTGANDAASWGYRNTNPGGVIAGWVNVNDTRAEVHKDTVGGVKAAEGTYWFDMEGANKNAKLVQTVAGVEQGKTYQLKFSIADTDTAQTSDTIKVYWGGQLVYTGTPVGKWQEITIDVIGGAGDGSNKLAFESVTANSNGAGVALDNVSMIKIDANPNLIVNGSFEDLTGANNGSLTDWGYRNTNPNGIIPGWAQVNTAAGGRAEVHWDTQNGVKAKDGNNWFDMDGNGNNAKLVQTVAGVETGKTYDLSFSIADADGRAASNDDGIRVLWGGQVIYEGLPGQAWQTINLHVVGGAGDGLNQLVFEGTETALNGYGAALDDVQLRKSVETPITGSAGSDTLNGTAGHDVLVGGTGNDTLQGGNDADTYVYRSGDGSDRIVEAAGASGTDVLALENVNRDAATFYRHGSDVEIVLQDGSKVTLTGQLAGGGVEMVTFADGTVLKAAAIASAIVNRGPVAADDTGFGTEYGTELTITSASLLANDGDADLDALTLLSVTSGIGGTVALDANGNVVFTPADGFEGAASFTYTASDGHGGTATGSVSITVEPKPNEAPVAVDDAGLDTAYASALTIDLATLLANDSDADADALTLQSVTSVAGGTVVLDGQGHVVFTPEQGFVGEASFTYTVSDGHGGVATATVNVTVAPPTGTDGDDEFTATPGDDTILAGLGDDEVHGGAGNDVIDGGTGDDTLFGDEGDDVLKGGAGDSALHGGAGNDILIGDAEDDVLDGGDGIDTADYSGDTAGIVVDLAAGTADGDGIGSDELTSIETVIGGAGNDTLIGDAGDNVFVGGLGDDIIDGGAGFDTLDLSGATGPVSVDFVHGTVSGAGIGSDSFTNIEKLLFGAGDDMVSGGNGDEGFDGGAGNDTLKGGAGNDTLAGGEGNDTLDGGSGDDVVSGGLGDDTIKAGSGNDSVDAGAGNDTVDAGSGDDVILAGAGNDTVDAGSGDDRIVGGAGDDVLTGGSGHDVFVFAADFGKDLISDFKTTGTSSDVLEFSHDVFADATAALAAAHQDGSDVVFTIDADTTLTLRNVQLTSLHDFHFV